MNYTLIQMTRLEDEPTNGADMERMTMIVLPSSVRWGGKADKYAYTWFTTQTEKHWKSMFIGLRSKKPLATPMSGNRTTTLFENTKLFDMQSTNGREMMMAMVFEKFIQL